MTYIFLLFLFQGMLLPLSGQQQDEELDSLIHLFKQAGRNWNTYAHQFIAIGEPAVPALITLLQDSSETQWNRRIAAMTLNDMRSPAYVEPALSLLLDRNQDPVLRNQVTHGLKGFDLSVALTDLWEVFQEEKDNEFFRLNIASLLTNNDPVLAFRAFEEIYLESEGFCKQQSLKSMVSLRPHEASKWYISALQSTDWMTATLAMDSLIANGNFASGRMIRLYNRNDTPELVRWRITYILGHRPEKDHMYQLLAALEDPGWLVHNEAALALSRMKSNLMLPELRYLEQSGSPELAERAAWVIRQLNKKSNGKTASMQPFDGYPRLEDRDEIIKVLKKKCIDTLSFKPGEVIADIGAGNGYLEAMLAMFHNDLTFYIQDIDPEICNPATVEDAVNFYQKVRGRPFTCRFIPVNGTDTETNLPDQTFDKILMLWTYQYLKEPAVFISDVREKLKVGGLFILVNPDQEFEYGKLLALEYGWNGSTVEKQISDIIKGGFELVRFARNYEDEELPYVMVFKKK
jgi:SAM-dependent methyltransferase